MSEDNIIYLARLICLIFLFIVLFYKQPVNNKIKEPIIQIIIAIIIIFIFIFIDPLAGFFIACAIFVIYYKFYIDNDTNTNNNNIKKNTNTSKKDIPYNSYITNEHLDKAQNNLVSSNDNEEITPENTFNLSKMQIFNNPNPPKQMPGYEKPWNDY